MEVNHHNSLPKIDIGPTVTNEMMYLLELLAPTKDLARLIRNHDSYFSSYFAEMRFLSQLTNHQNTAHTEEEITDYDAHNRKLKRVNNRRMAWLSRTGPLLR
jgi:hypothetical protein